MMEFSTEDIVKLAASVRLELTQEEIARFVKEVPEILAYVGKLSAVNTEGVVPMSHGGASAVHLRADEAVVCEASVSQAIVASFPDKAGKLLRVPSVFAGRAVKKDE